MIKVGLTGGIGSGKSVVAELLKTMNIPIYNSDIEAKRIMHSSNIVREKIIELFGEKAYIGQSLNRAYIASVVFSDKGYLYQLNKIVHPAVRKDFENWAKSQNSDIVAIESAILLESDLQLSLDYTINISAPLEMRINRVQQRDKLPKEQILQRIANQMNEEDRILKANFTIYNDDKQVLIPQTMRILTILRDKETKSQH